MVFIQESVEYVNVMNDLPFLIILENEVKTINVKDYGAGNQLERNDTTAFQNALNVAKVEGGANIYIPEGTYRMTDTLEVFENTHITVNPRAKIIRDHDGYLMVNVEPNVTYDSYNGNGNITIEGGIWDQNGVKRPSRASCFSFSHARNITFRDLTILDAADSHAIELNSTYNGEVNNVRFLGINNVREDKSTEALQLDLSKAHPVAPSYDNTPSQHIKITNCYFGESNTKGSHPWPRGIGTHTATIGRWFEHIEISDNIFENVTNWAIRGYSWNDVIINNNRIINGGAGIAINPPQTTDEKDTVDLGGNQLGKSQDSTSIIIKNNEILNSIEMSEGIRVYGEETGKIRNIKIANNYINSLKVKSGIKIGFCEDIIISDNEIIGITKEAIFIRNSNNVVKSNNVIH